MTPCERLTWERLCAAVAAAEQEHIDVRHIEAARFLSELVRTGKIKAARDWASDYASCSNHDMRRAVVAEQNNDTVGAETHLKKAIFFEAVANAMGSFDRMLSYQNVDSRTYWDAQEGQ